MKRGVSPSCAIENRSASGSQMRLVLHIRSTLLHTHCSLLSTGSQASLTQAPSHPHPPTRPLATISPARSSPSPTQSLSSTLPVALARCRPLMPHLMPPVSPPLTPAPFSSPIHPLPPRPRCPPLSFSLTKPVCLSPMQAHARACHTHTPMCAPPHLFLTHGRSCTQAPTHNLSIRNQGGARPPLTHSPGRPPLTHSQLAEGRTLTHSQAEAGGTPPLTHSPQSSSPLHTAAS